MKTKIAATFKITNKFSTAAAPDVPRESKIATKTTTKIAKISTTPPLVPKAADNCTGNLKPSGSKRPCKLAESPEATKATAIKYSASKAQPAIQPKPSPKTTFIQE